MHNWCRFDVVCLALFDCVIKFNAVCYIAVHHEFHELYSSGIIRWLMCISDVLLDKGLIRLSQYLSEKRNSGY